MGEGLPSPLPPFPVALRRTFAKTIVKHSVFARSVVLAQRRGSPPDPPGSSRNMPPPSWGIKMVTVIRIEHFWPPRAHPDWRGLTQLGSYWPRFAQMGPDWFRLTQIRPYGFRLLGLYWPRFAQIGPYGPRLVHIGPDWPRFWVQIGSYGPRFVHIGLDSPIGAQIGSYWFRLAQILGPD